MVVDQIALTHRGRRAPRLQRRLVGEVLAALTIGAMVLALLGLGQDANRDVGPASPHRALGEIRCEGQGAIVINVDGKDYAVNGMAGSRYPPIQSLWTKDSHPELDIGHLIVQGITLCDW
jgi:hypothetical protein